METKTCTKCKEAKPLNKFYKDYTGKMSDGIDYYCKYCRMGTSIQSRQNKKKKCTVDPCGRPHYAKGWCRNHYERMKRNGKLESCFEII